MVSSPNGIVWTSSSRGSGYVTETSRFDDLPSGRARVGSRLSGAMPRRSFAAGFAMRTVPLRSRRTMPSFRACSRRSELASSSATSSYCSRRCSASSFPMCFRTPLKKSFNLFLPFVDHALDLALAARQGAGGDELDLRREADDLLDRVGDAAADLLDAGHDVGESLALEFDLELEEVHRVRRGEADQVVGRHLRNLHETAFDLAREDVDAVDDQHVVRTGTDAVHDAHGPSACARAGLQAREVAGAVADHRRARAVERGEDELAFLAVG